MLRNVNFIQYIVTGKIFKEEKNSVKILRVNFIIRSIKILKLIFLHLHENVYRRKLNEYQDLTPLHSCACVYFHIVFIRP